MANGKAPARTFEDLTVWQRAQLKEVSRLLDACMRGIEAHR
jgi:hypothetical protein